MKQYYFLMAVMVLTSSCNSEADTAATKQTIENARLDSSAIINDSSRLPNDSTNTGVQH